MRFSTTPNECLWLYVIAACCTLALLSVVHTMSFDDEARQTQLYCELAAEGTWPANPNIPCDTASPSTTNQRSQR